MAAVNPFVVYKPFRVVRINSTPKKIFSASDYVCLIDTLMLTSDGLVNTKVDLFVNEYVSEGVYIKKTIFNFIPINPPNTVEILKDSFLTMSPGDELYALSDDSSKFFNCIGSYRELTEENVTEV